MDIQQLLQQIFGGAQPSPNLLVNPGQPQGRVPNLLAQPAPQTLPQDQFGSRFAGVQPQAAPPMPPPVNVQDRPVAEAPRIDPWEGLREVTQRPAVDPMMTGATPVPQTSGGGIFGGLTSKFADSGFKDRLGDMMLGWGMGGTAQESLAMGNKAIMAGNLTRKEKGQQNQTVEFLKSKGLSDEEARVVASDRASLSDFLKQLRDGQDPRKALELRKLEAEVSTAENPTAKLTTDQREYEQAKSQGFDGSFMDYQIKMKEAGRNQVNIDTGEKLPSGFRWKDPNKRELGVEPIPGGPGAQIPAELAARVGMADSFLGQFDKIREKVSKGEVTGVVDRFKAANTAGGENETFRQIQSGTDALLRMLTGAGMPEAEARSYVERYMPTYRDNAESATSKLDQLKRELESASSMAMRGRGGFTSPAADTNNNDPLGIR